MNKNFVLGFAVLLTSTAAFAQLTGAQLNPGIDIDAYQVNYAANLNVADSVVNITNTGVQGPFFQTGAIPGLTGNAAATAGNICVNAYVFDAIEEEVACCSCLVTPNGLNSLSARQDLISDTLTPAVPTSIVVKLVATQPGTDSTGHFSVCNPASINLTLPAANLPYIPGAAQTGKVAAGMRAWMNTTEPDNSTYTTVHSSFLPSALIDWEAAGLASACNFIQVQGSTYGICKSCRTGALAGTKK